MSTLKHHIWQTTSGASSHGNSIPIPLVDIKVVAVKFLYKRPFVHKGNFLVKLLTKTVAQ